MDFLGGARGRKAVVTTTKARAQAAPRPPKPATVSRNALAPAVRARIARAEPEAGPPKKKRHSAAQRAAPHADRPSTSQSPTPPAEVRARFTYSVPRDVCDEPGYDPVPRDMRTGDSGRHISAAELVRTSTARYTQCASLLTVFADLEHPLVTLEYPADPEDADEFDPIAELLAVARAIATHYVPAAQQPLFGLADDIESDPGLVAARDADGEPIFRTLSKARNRRNGTLFVSAVDRFNAQIRTLRNAGALRDTIARTGREHGVPEGVWRTIQEQVYARVVAGHVDSLKRYEAFSDHVYGEMLPPFLSEVSRVMALGPGSVFVDLGSGIGNLLVQASLQSGCDAYGCEVMTAPAALAHAQILQATARWRMWGIRGSRRLESWCADFTESDRVRAVLRRADVLLVNNYAFSPRTNDALSLLFLDLEDGARIVSLRRFVPHDFRLTERTLSSPMAILSVEERTYGSGCVSWTGGGGKYYVHTVDRSRVRAFVESEGGRD